MSGHSQLPGASRIRRRPRRARAVRGRRRCRLGWKGAARSARRGLCRDGARGIPVPAATRDHGARQGLPALDARVAHGWADRRQAGLGVRRQPRARPAQPSRADHALRARDRQDRVRDGRHAHHGRAYGGRRGRERRPARASRRPDGDDRRRGRSGREHLSLLPLVRELETIQIASLHVEDARRACRPGPAGRGRWSNTVPRCRRRRLRIARHVSCPRRARRR